LDGYHDAVHVLVETLEEGKEDWDFWASYGAWMHPGRNLDNAVSFMIEEIRTIRRDRG
jgi:hypothetical protein